MKSLSIGIYALFVAVCSAQTIPTDSLYLGQTPPGSTPKIFKLPVNSGSRAWERVAISPDEKQIYYTESETSIHRIKYLSYAGNKWNGPFVLFEGYWNPALSISGDTMYFLDGNNQNLNNNNPNAWYSVKSETGWSTPVKFWNHKCSKAYFQKTNKGNYYFATIDNAIGTYSVISKLIIGNSDTIIQSLGAPINAPENGAGFYIAEDESYIISPHNSNSFHTLVISYRKNDGGWTNSKSLGTSINISADWYPWGAYVTRDNKYLFYTNWFRTSPNPYIYWVSLGNLIDSLKKTNFIPYVKSGIANQVDTAGHLFGYTIPDSTFIDDDGNNTLTYSVTLSNGSSLPAWLSFNSTTRTFSGTPTTTGVSTIKVTATDTANASASCTFKITVVAGSNGVEEDNDQLPKKFALQQNYPNPFNPNTIISYQLPVISDVKLSIFDALGREVATLVNEKKPAGSYTVQWNASGMPSGIYFYRLQAGSFTEAKKFVLLR